MSNQFVYVVRAKGYSHYTIFDNPESAKKFADKLGLKDSVPFVEVKEVISGY